MRPAARPEYPDAAMRGAARAAWSIIKTIPGIEDLNKEWKTTYAMEGCQ